jgi:DNA-binding PadR family transcriptional regulator
MLLGFLLIGDMTGYELRKLFTLSFSFFSAVSYGSIYPALKKMEGEGHITMRLEVQDGAPNRKVYAITDAGKKAFQDALAAPFPFERHRNSFLTRLFFFAHLPREERIRTATEYLHSVKQVQTELEAVGPQIEQRADRFQYACFQFGQRYFQDLVRNVEETIRTISTESDRREQ